MRLAKKSKNTTSNTSKGLSTRPAIGVEINQSAIKMVQLSGRSLNQIQLEKYVITKLPKNIVKGSKIQDYEQLVSYLQHSYAQLRTSNKNIVAAIPQNLATIETVIHNAKDSDMDLESFAEFEVSQIAPIEEINYDYQVIGTSISPAGHLILLVAAKKEDIEMRIELFESAGLPLSSMDIDLFAQNNAISFWINQHAPELAYEKMAVFGIYENTTYALVVQNGQILYKQEISVSMEQLNQLVQSTYQVTEEKAEQMINSSEKLSDYQERVADRFNYQTAQEIQRVLQYYYTTQSADELSNIKHIMLTGKASLIGGLPEAIFAQTNTQTECINPVVYAARGSKVDPAQLHIDSPSLTIAFGLALRGL